MKAMFSLCAILLILLGAAAEALAQSEGAMEYGYDAGLTISFIDSRDYNVTTLELPIQAFRIGIFVSDAFKVEPSLALAVASGGGRTDSHLLLGLDMERVFRLKEGVAIPFIGLGGQYEHVDVGPAGGGQFGVKLEGGFYVPTRIDGLCTRVYAQFGRRFESDDALGRTFLGFGLGLSFFTR